MPRPPRIELAGAIHHVWARGALQQTMFRDEEDHRRYLWLLARVVRWMSWRCLTWCLMGNHVHLLIETPGANLGKGIQQLHGEYARRFNRRHGKQGHAFDRRYGANLIESDIELWVVASYIANNPVAAGLCATPEAWRWSAHRSLVAGAAPAGLDPDRLLSFFESLGGDPRERYVEWVRVNRRANLKGLAL